MKFFDALGVVKTKATRDYLRDGADVEDETYDRANGPSIVAVKIESYRSLSLLGLRIHFGNMTAGEQAAEEVIAL